MSLNEADFSQYLEENSPIPPDVVFLVQDDEKGIIAEYKAHRQFLSVVSPVFQKTFFGSFGVPENPMAIKDTFPASFSLLLDYIYKGESDFQLFNQTRIVIITDV
ncbi:uncharacterized protein LOC111711667 [Eurytemora carolleeae]|uniref:uncharacterized protein LOC111711667 n=1 Tax=Eurytemora carolleeae TaxID=1294199 RepID=UPI000C780DA1|nr:uncharacterized protein LOC111711667 [Eurytemora carolleeae]|eukprot:XP_023341832.1 uncharacterized protein LOC111711667 [Eurytemora affinis]